MAVSCDEAGTARHNRVVPADGLLPEPCAGVYARVLRPGLVRRGDAVRLIGS
jgi:uncharacterized protein